MLVLTRKKNESLVIGDNIEIMVIDIQGDQVRLGINAPRSVSIHRKELVDEIIEANRSARLQADNLEELIKTVEADIKNTGGGE